MISFLKYCFDLGRCTWRGFESFKVYAWSSVVTANLAPHGAADDRLSGAT